MFGRKMYPFLLCLLAFLFINQTQEAEAESFGTWYKRNPMATGNTLNSIAYGNNIFVAVGNADTICISDDGMTWKETTSRTGAWLQGIAHGNNTFVAVGSMGTILTSPDGVTWNQRFSGTNATLHGIAYANNIFVAVGTKGNILTSSDGVTWIERTSGTGQDLGDIAYGNNSFVAVGQGIILTSSDGVIWVDRISGTQPGPRPFVSVHSNIAYGNNSFVIATGSTILTSPDGEIWNERYLGLSSFSGITYAQNTFVAVGYSGAIYTSPDTESWTERSSGTEALLQDIVYGENVFVTVGGAGIILISPDGVSWEVQRISGWEPCLDDIIFANNTFTAVGCGGTILTSPDGVSWVKRISGTDSHLKGIAFGNNTFVAVGSEGTILTSPDGVEWTRRPSKSNDLLNGIAFGNNTFVAVGYYGTILTSPDGLVWKRSDVGYGFYAVTYANHIFFLTGYWFADACQSFCSGGIILTSTDGVDWINNQYGSLDFYSEVAFGNNHFVALGSLPWPPYGWANDDFILISPDGDVWETIRLENEGFRGRAYGLTFANNTFVAVGSLGMILTSSNGLTWVERFSGTDALLRDIAYGNDSFVAVGDGGVILQSYRVKLPVSKIGFYSKGYWYFDQDGNGVWEGCQFDDCLGPFGGLEGDIPLVGDWRGTGMMSPGIYRRGMWYLDLDGNGSWDGCQVDGCLGPFGGLEGDIPVVGDWTGAGIINLGIYRQGMWYLDLNGNGIWEGCQVDGCLGPFGGLEGDSPVVGDWTGAGITNLGIYRRGMWYLDLDGNGSWDGCEVDACFGIFGGMQEDKPLVGDWMGGRKARIGIYRNGDWFFDINGNSAWDGCELDACILGFGGDRSVIPICK